MKLGIDIENIADQGAVMEIEHPVTEQPIVVNDKAWFIKLLGGNSKSIRNLRKKQANERVFRNSKLKGKDKDFLPSEAENIELAQTAIMDWHITDDKKKPIELTKENVAKIMADNTWLLDDVLYFIDSDANFMMSV